MAIAAPLPSARRAAEPAVATTTDTSGIRQYSLGQIGAIWAAAALPMAFLAWVVAPWLSHHLDGPGRLPKALLLCLTGGLIWQFVLVAGLVFREQRSLRPSRLRQALWLNAPRSPRTGRRGGLLWLVLIPLILGFGVEELLPEPSVPGSRDFTTFLDSHAGHALLAGHWGWFALIVVLAVFNTVLGEELLFRGVLLPRMNGVFGRRDWLANGVLFATYHLHMPWVIPTALADTFLLSYPSKRYRSALVGIAVHSMQSAVLLGICLSLVLA
jgi:membrane protease YdiL (CAAX protease family)